MKKTGLIMIMGVTIALMVVFIIFGNWKQSIDASQLVEIDGLVYVSETTRLLTGESFVKYENGTFQRKENWKEGLRNGEAITYYENGKIEKKEKWKNGKLNGKSVKYSEDGKVAAIEIWKDGELKNKNGGVK